MVLSLNFETNDVLKSATTTTHHHYHLFMCVCVWKGGGGYCDITLLSLTFKHDASISVRSTPSSDGKSSETTKSWGMRSGKRGGPVGMGKDGM